MPIISFRRTAALFLFAFALAAATALVGAAKVKVQTQYDKTFDFKGLHTYAWHPTGAGDVKVLQSSDDNPAQLRAQLEPMIVRSVDAALAQRGFTLATSGTPDLHVYYYVLIGPSIASQTMGMSISAAKLKIFGLSAAMAGLAGGLLGSLQSRVGSLDFLYFRSLTLLLVATIFGITSLEIYEQGTLIVDLSVPSRNSMVWRGSAQTEVDRRVSVEGREKRIRDAVQEMLKKFPPKK